MRHFKKYVFVTLFITGIVAPHIYTFLVIQAFYLLYPYIFIFVVTLILLVISVFSKETDYRNWLFAFSLLPFFLLVQIFSTFIYRLIVS